MASTDSMGTPTSADHPAPTARSHYAHMRCAERAARNLSDLLIDGKVPADERDAVKAQREGYYMLAAAYRSAARRLERGERLRVRLGAILRPVLRGVRRAIQHRGW